MSSTPLVTIVTPSFNHARFIRATIESVLSQDYPNVEYIVMDGGSTDETSDVVAPYLDRLTYVSEKDRGQSHAINKGFAMARGEIVAWLNSDDLYSPGAISTAVRAFLANPSAGVVYGEGYQIDIDGNVKCVFPHTRPFDLWRLVHVSDYILQQSTFFRKAALDEIGPIREDLHFVMDWDVLIRLGKRYDFVYVPEYLGSLREYDAAKTFSGGIKRAQEIRRMLQSHTGKMLPEGFIVYGLDTYAQAWGEKIRSWPTFMDWLKGPLERRITALAHHILGYVNTHAQGVYHDRWLGKKAHVMLRKGSGDIVFRGQVPGIPQVHRQAATISSAGRVCAVRRLEPGDFEIRFPAPVHATECAASFEISMSRSFVPAKIGDSQDTRALSVVFYEFSWQAREEEEGAAALP